MSPDMPRVDDPNQLRKWESWCRGAAIDFELGADLRFGVAGSREATLTDAAGKKIVSLIRPPKKTFQTQLAWLDIYADLREDRGSEILDQIGLNSNYWSMIAFLNPARTPRTFEVLLAMLRLAISVEMRFKHAFACPRAIEYSPQVQPMIQTPGHGSLPSGHSTQSHAIARVFYELLPASRKTPLLYDELMRQAARIAINRTVAGVHFPVDSVAGRVLGTSLAEYFVSRATRARYTPRTFDGKKFPAASDFLPGDGIKRGETIPIYLTLGRDTQAAASPLLKWLWDEAKKEW